MLKRFFIRLLIIIVLASIIFFSGWVTLWIKPGYYALYISKTSGVRELIIKPGDFVWNLEALLPTNVTLIQYKPTVYYDTFELSGVLPSAQAYKAFIGGNPDFSWKINASISVAINYEYLPVLYKTSGISSYNDIMEFLQQKSKLLKQKIQEQFFVTASNDFLHVLDGIFTKELSQKLAQEFNELSLSNLTINFTQLPDFSSYFAAQKLYEEYLEKFQKALEPALLESASLAVKQQTEIEQLKKYGELFKQYPELIQYLALKAGITIPKP